MRRICLVIVDVRSTHNVGSFFRTADGFNSEIVLIGITPRPEGAIEDDRLPHIVQKAQKAINKTALGAEQTVDWKYFSTVKDAFNHLRAEGFSLYAIEQNEKSNQMTSLPPKGDIALIVGPEVEGLSIEMLNMCDKFFEIPMLGKKESFNVSVAAGIALYQARN